MASGFAEALVRHSRQVQKLQGAQADEFLKLLRNTQERIQGRYASLGGQGNPLDAFRLRTMQGEAEAAIKVLEAKAGGLYDKASQEAVELSIEHIGGELDRLSVHFDAKPLDVAIDAQKVLADPAQGLLANHFETSVARYGGELLNGVRRELFTYLRGGGTIGETVQAIAGNSGPFGTVGRSNAKRLVRTEVGQAYGAATHTSQHEAAKQVPGLNKVWLHVGSWKCPVCMPLHGTERPLDKDWVITISGKKSEVAHPPGHPNCTCRMSTMKSSWRDGMRKLGYLDRQTVLVEQGRSKAAPL